ncbi:MAG: hypothetical protein ABJA16_01830 [Nakamurella sp.]
MAGFEMFSDGVRGVAASIREGSELAAQAGVALVDLAAGLPPPPVGLRLTVALEALSASWANVLADVVADLAQLATWMDDAVTATVAADSTAGQVFRGVRR